jgi:hypothetical protein
VLSSATPRAKLPKRRRIDVVVGKVRLEATLTGWQKPGTKGHSPAQPKHIRASPSAQYLESVVVRL